MIINRPERRNALNAAMWGAIPSGIAGLANDRAIRMIAIRGEGREAFSAGADISEFAENRADAAKAAAYEALNGAAFQAVRDCPKPVIAAISGYCFGGGLALALASDLRIAAQSAVFSLPPARLGLAYPAAGLSDLLSAVSLSTAKDMIFSARRIEAAEALELGLIDRLVAESDFDVAVDSAFGAIAANAPLTLRHAKHALDRLAGRAGAASAEDIGELAAACFNSADYAEGQRAFLEKRKPQFRGA